MYVDKLSFKVLNPPFSVDCDISLVSCSRVNDNTSFRVCSRNYKFLWSRMSSMFRIRSFLISKCSTK